MLPQASLAVMRACALGSLANEVCDKNGFNIGLNEIEKQIKQNRADDHGIRIAVKFV
jgi:hypothetical protein